MSIEPKFGWPAPYAIYRQEEDEELGVMGCTILETVIGPKDFARIWDGDPSKVEWGWTLHGSAVKIWEPEDPETKRLKIRNKILAALDEIGQPQAAGLATLLSYRLVAE